MFKEIYGTLTMTQEEKDRKRFEELYDKPFRDFLGIEEDTGVSKSRQAIYNVLYGGYDKREHIVAARKEIEKKLQHDMGMLAQGNADMSSVLRKETAMVLQSHRPCIEQMDECVASLEKAFYYDWYGKQDKAKEYIQQTEEKGDLLLNMVSQVVYDRFLEKGIIERETGKVNMELVSQIANRKSKLARRTPSVQRSNDMGLDEGMAQ